MSPREAQQTDPQQRLALVTAYEALERAGFVANRTNSTNLHRIGTFYGQTSDDYREVNISQEISTYFIPGGCRAFGPGRINYFFKFSGPSYSIDTACSSSLASIQAACSSLWTHDTDMAVAGGMSVLTNPDGFAGLSNGHFLSKTANACKTWDVNADGYCRADAVASIVLKRLEDAEADNDTILGVIISAATNHSAEAHSITHPHAGSQASLGRLVMSKACVDPLDVSYVEMHGTGTQAGDAEEIQSVTNVFAPATRGRSSKNPLYIGAVKSNVGHSESAAGVTALIKVLLMFQYSIIPRHVGIKTSLNPLFPKDLDQRNVRIPYEHTEWPRMPGKKRIAVVNNFSAAGGNTTVALEDGPAQEEDVSCRDPRSYHAILVSAKCRLSLKGNIERLLKYLDNHPNVELADLAYTTTARRCHYNYRVACTGSSLEQIKKQLMVHLESVDIHKPIRSTGQPSVAFIFTGQGASYKSSNLDLFHQEPYFRSQILQLDSLAQRQGFPSFVPAIDGSHPIDHQHSVVVTHLALVCSEIALAKYWDSLGVKPDVVVGHSLGEYAGLYCAGVLSAADAIFLVGRRAGMLERSCASGSHKMVAVRASLSQIQESIEERPYEIACINGPKENVITGRAEEMDAIIPILQNSGYKCHSLDVAFAFHSSQTDAILDEFEETANSSVVFQAPHIPVVSPLLGKVVFDDKTINANYLRRATRETVNLKTALERALNIGTVGEDTVWVEIGPHPVCVPFIRSTLPINIAVPSLHRGEENWTTMVQGLTALHCAGVSVRWNVFHSPFEKVLRLLDLPTYAWNDKTYWIQYTGDWSLTKGNTFYDADRNISNNKYSVPKSNLSTSSVQMIVEETLGGLAGTVVMQSDVAQVDFRAATWGHKMNQCGVVTSSIHADIAYTLGEYLYKKLKPCSPKIHIEITGLEVLRGLVANNNRDTPQLLQVSVTTANIDFNTAALTWRTVATDGTVSDPFATATLIFGDAAKWLASWVPMTHLVRGRIQDLERLANMGVANRFSHNMAYQLFASSLVDYTPKYRGMQSVVLHEMEAFADIVLSTDKGGVWTVPPHFIDSVAHLAGFIMNVSDALDTTKNFSVTPGWRSMRFAKPLVPGARYQSYVKMIPTSEDPSIYLGDVYVLQDDALIGVTEGLKFRQYPRLLLSRFFSAPDDVDASPGTSLMMPSPRKLVLATDMVTAPEAVRDPAVPKPAFPAQPVPTAPAPPHAPQAEQVPGGSNNATVGTGNTTSGKALRIIADEAALELGDMADETSFSSLGVDSLMSLVVAERFRAQLGVVVSGSLFLEYPTVGHLRNWLDQYYS